MSQYLVIISPLTENFIDTIAKDYNLPANELKKRYLYTNKKVFDKTIKKFKPHKTRNVHAYNIFLSDKKVLNTLSDDKSKINREKGELWNELKSKPEIYSKYNNIAMMENLGLLEKTYRQQILQNWSKYETTISKLLEEKENNTLESCLQELNLKN